MITFTNPWLTSGDTLICFGDSLVNAGNNFVDILKERLTPKGIEVIKSGRGGDKTPWALTRLQRDVIDRKPAAVSIMLGTNDAQIGRGKWADEPLIPPDVYRSNLIWMMHLCRLSGIQKFSITPPLWRFEGALWAEVGDVFPPYCQAARDAASAMQARFVPADVAFAEEWSKHPGHTGLLLTADGGHLNARGNQIVADASLAAWGLMSEPGTCTVELPH
jgi:lysophospholipase L1-like esterase